MHRFVWDLHYPPPDALQHEYPISAIYHDTPRLPFGPAVLPGPYTVKLTVAGQSFTQPLAVKMDPRVRTPADGLKQQFDLETRIVAGMNTSFQTRQQVQALRAQLKTLAERAGQGAVADAITALDKKSCGARRRRRRFSWRWRRGRHSARESRAHQYGAGRLAARGR